MWPLAWLRPFAAVTRDSLLAAFRALPGSRILESDSRPVNGVPTFVMMPLDFALDTAWLSGSALEEALTKLVEAGVHGVMVDVWWGICERTAQEYEFSRYVELAELCQRLGLKMQATMCFHACGGNVGDTVNIPLPNWVIGAADAHHAWYMDRSQRAGTTSDVNKECITLGADHMRILACKEAGVYRSPIEAYAQFMSAFCEKLSTHVSTTISEIQVGMGPCGELRYPSYPMPQWVFPGIGEFQCFDEHLMKDLAKSATDAGHPVEWCLPPDGTGSYNDTPQNTPFFRTEYRSPRAQFFQRWYAGALLRHGDDVLSAAREAAPAGTVLAVKISGVHWWYFSRSRPAEATTGYYMSGEDDFYEKVAKLLLRHAAVLDFTCLEMKTFKQPWRRARCGPRQLVRDVFRTAAEAGVPVAGENALECYDLSSYKQIVQAYRWTNARAHGFTLLRLTPALLEKHHLANLAWLSRALRDIRPRR